LCCAGFSVGHLPQPHEDVEDDSQEEQATGCLAEVGEVGPGSDRSHCQILVQRFHVVFTSSSAYPFSSWLEAAAYMCAITSSSGGSSMVMSATGPAWSTSWMTRSMETSSVSTSSFRA